MPRLQEHILSSLMIAANFWINLNETTVKICSEKSRGLSYKLTIRYINKNQFVQVGGNELSHIVNVIYFLITHGCFWSSKPMVL